MASRLCTSATTVPACSSSTCIATLQNAHVVVIPRCSFQSASLSSSSFSIINNPPSPPGSWRRKSRSRSRSRSSRTDRRRSSLPCSAAAHDAAGEGNDRPSISSSSSSNGKEGAGAGAGAGGAFEVEGALEDVLRGDWSRKLLDSLANRVLRDDDKESQALLKDFAAAAERVAKAKEELESIDRRERDLAVLMSQIVSRAVDEEAQVTSLVSERERDVLAAEEELKAAELALVTARAGGSLASPSSSRSPSDDKWENGAIIDEDEERAESLKAMVVADLVGTLAGLPFLLSGKEFGIGALVSIGGLFFSCALFGVAYRYILRRDLGNIPLKFGATAAFSLVRAFGELDAAIQSHMTYSNLTEGVTASIEAAAIGVTAGVYSFGFSALALDYCLREGIISPFPIRKV